MKVRSVVMAIVIVIPGLRECCQLRANFYLTLSSSVFLPYTVFCIVHIANIYAACCLRYYVVPGKQSASLSLPIPSTQCVDMT